MAREAALKEVANSRLRRLLAFNKSCAGVDVKIGDAGLFYKAQNQESAPWRGGPALNSDIHEAGVTARFQSPVLKVARFCARKRGEGKDVGQDKSGSARARVSARVRLFSSTSWDRQMWGRIWRWTGRMRRLL